MKPLTSKDGFKINPKLPLSKLIENHPEITISKPLLSKHDGRPFAVYTHNLFESGATENLAALRNREMPITFTGNKTTSIIHLDRVGYTVEDWIEKFGEWVKNPSKQA
jgi:hypothetical protein